MSRDKDLTNKFSRDGYELGQSKNAAVMQGQDSFGMSAEYLRKLFVKIRNPEKYPELDEKILWNEDGSVQGIDNTKFKKAAERGQRMEPMLREWACDIIDNLCYEYHRTMSCDLHIPKQGYRKKEHRMVASLDAVIEIMNGKLPYHCPHTHTEHTLYGKGVLEIKTSADHLVPSVDNVLQIQGQMFCSDYNWGFIGIYNKKQHFDLHFYKRNQEIINKLLEKVDEFWNRVDNDIEYPESLKQKKEFVDYNNHKASNALIDAINTYQEAKHKVTEWTNIREDCKATLASILKNENAPHITIGDHNISLDLITRNATPEQVVPAKPATTYEKLTVKEK